MLERDDVMRDALSDLLQAETRYAPVVDGEGRIAGVLSVEIISEFLTSPEALTEEHPAAERPLADEPCSPSSWARLPLAQSELGRTSSAIVSNPDCVQRQRRLLLRLGRSTTSTATSTPLLQHLVLVSVSVALGFADRLGAGARLPPPPLARAPDHGRSPGVLYTVPSIAFFFLLLPITGRGTDTAIIALTAYTLQIIYRNTVAGLANVPPRRGTPAGAWA